MKILKILQKIYIPKIDLIMIKNEVVYILKIPQQIYIQIDQIMIRCKIVYIV